MSSSSEEDISEKNLKDYEYEQYSDLKKGRIKVKYSSTVYRCPYCPGKRKQDLYYKDLLHHASSFGRSTSRGVKTKAKHLALERYMKRYLDGQGHSESAKKSECTSMPYGDKKFARSRRPLDVPVPFEQSKKSESTPTPDGDHPRRHHDVRGHSEPSKKSEHHHLADGDQEFVYPWMGILANIQTEWKQGKKVAESGSKLRDEFLRKGFNPLKVFPLWGYRGHTGFAIVEFKNDWAGFNNAMSFEKSFEVEHCGKRDYYGHENPGNKLYGWVARSDDYYSRGFIGDHLKKNADLKTISAKEAEDQRKASKLVSNLTNTLASKSLHLEEMKNKYLETNASLNRLMMAKDTMLKKFNEQIRMVQQKSHNHFAQISLEHQKSTQRLEEQMKRLEQREKELQQREAQNETERRELLDEKKMVERATLEQKYADEKVLKLAEEQKIEKEKLHSKIIELEKKLDARQALELEIERMRGALHVMKHMGEDGDMEVKKNMDAIKEDLKEKEEELENMEALQQALVIKERKSNDELQEARKELISGMREVSTRAFIGTKRMGELDTKPFLTAMKRKASNEEAAQKAIELCSQWEDYLRDPSWHPFKIITDKEGNSKEEINEEDEKMKSLKNDGDDEVYEAVKVALMEMNEYNPSGRYIIQELWNFKEGRKATLKEGVLHVLNKWKSLKRKRR
ncbi:factor of DNA methylation 4 [Quercus suber]|uniref:factor of DNA methylation 4 n=1 Tax=Quercus suber TaxID=58331 RepID=UPI000CE1941C|nr:factor of DNA methylation 4-like [Quercus suber]